MTHVHPCAYQFPTVHQTCGALVDCDDDCVEDEQETIVFCVEHQAIVDSQAFDGD